MLTGSGDTSARRDPGALQKDIGPRPPAVKVLMSPKRAFIPISSVLTYSMLQPQLSCAYQLYRLQRAGRILPPRIPWAQCRRFDLAMIVLTEQRNVPLRRSTPSACGTRPELLLWKPCRDRTVRRPRCLSAAFFSVPWANDGRSSDCPTTRTGERRSRQPGKSHPPNS